jgi:DNA-binding NtrC family response regulator
MAQRIRCPVCRAPLLLEADTTAIDETLRVARAAPLRKLEAVQRDHVLMILQAKQGHRREAAEALGIHVTTLRRWLAAWASQSAPPRRRNET